MLRTRPINRRRVVILIAENRDKGSEIKKVREVLTEAEFANVVFYSIDISQLISALTSKAQPNRPNTLPPGAEHLPMGQHQHAHHRFADGHGQLGSGAERYFRRRQGTLRARSPGCLHEIQRRPAICVQERKGVATRCPEDRRRTAQPVPAELQSQQSERGRLPPDHRQSDEARHQSGPRSRRILDRGTSRNNQRAGAAGSTIAVMEPFDRGIRGSAP